MTVKEQVRLFSSYEIKVVMYDDKNMNVGSAIISTSGPIYDMVSDKKVIGANIHDNVLVLSIFWGNYEKKIIEQNIFNAR